MHVLFISAGSIALTFSLCACDGGSASSSLDLASTSSAAPNSSASSIIASSSSSLVPASSSQAAVFSSTPVPSSAQMSSSSAVAAPLEPWMSGASNSFMPTIIENGIYLFDTDGNSLHAHGAGIIQVGDEYYWYGENRNDDQSFKSVRLYRSRNLRDWQFVNDILTQQSDPDLNFAKIERPKIIHNVATGQFIMWMHKEGGDNYGQARAAVAVSDTIDGNYQYRGSFRPLNYMSRDCTAFVDDDGTAYFLSAANENADLHLYRLTNDFTQIDSLVQKIWVGQKREAPAIIKRNGVYFLLTSGTSGWDPNQARYGTATSLGGTWTSTKAVGNSTTFDSQPTFILPIDGDTTTSYLYLGDRWLDPTYQDSKYVWLPLTFPNNTSLDFAWSTRIAVDTQTGELFASGTEEVRLQSKLSSKCLDVADESTADRGNIIQWSCTNKDNQKWRFTEELPGFYQIKALHSGKCLDVASASLANEANIVQYTCNQSDNQMWSKQLNDDGSFQLVSKNSDKCLDITSHNSDDGANIQQWTCTGNTNQKWVEN